MSFEQAEHFVKQELEYNYAAGFGDLYIPADALSSYLLYVYLQGQIDQLYDGLRKADERIAAAGKGESNG